jgi:DNA-binding NarL/FixJ family response regulator
MNSMSGSGTDANPPSDGPRERTCSLLLVDDDLFFRNGVRRLLRAVFPKSVIMEAATGAEAIDVLSERSIDCILLDHDMPGGPGLDWLSRLLEAHPELPVIMVTGKGSEQLAVNAMKEGAMDYLVKGDISPAALHRAVQNALKRKELLQTVEMQKQELLAAERQRVMIQSLGAACHHLGQPVTIITGYLEMMRRKEQSPEMREMIDNCVKAAESLGEILDRLRRVSEYRTVPYLPTVSDGPVRGDERILEI